MRLDFGKISAVVALVLISCGTFCGVFALLGTAAEERENAGMLNFESGLYRKINDGNVLFYSISFSPKHRRAILMLSREPNNEAEYKQLKTRFSRLEKTLPQGNLLFLTDDSGNIFHERELKSTRKVFELADEIRILFTKLKSVPVYYFPCDGARGKIDISHWEGNADAPVPENEDFF